MEKTEENTLNGLILHPGVINMKFLFTLVSNTLSRRQVMRITKIINEGFTALV